MKSFKKFLKEEEELLKEDEIPFDKHANHGWWGDKDHVDVYHGTHKRNVSSVKKHGLIHPDPKTGHISVTLDPHTAHGYASMASSGGEARFRGSGSKPANTPHHDRAVTKFRIPKEWLHKHMDHKFGGNLGDAKKRISSKDEYHKWRKENPNKPDHEYYQTSEFRVNKPVPPEFYVGHSHKVKK